MNIFTHAMAPVVLIRLTVGRNKDWSRRKWMTIGLAGALPDLLSPHWSIEARMNSWSHGLPFWGGFTLVLVGFALAKPRLLSPSFAAILSGAYLLHLICDAISGGIDWLHPLGTFVWGEYWVEPERWIPLDFLFLFALYAVFRPRKPMSG
jgi:hypothetical protein